MRYNHWRNIQTLMLLFFIALPGHIWADGKDTLKISVSILPQKYFVEQLFEPPLDVRVIIGPGQSPATYEPSPKQLAEFGKSSHYYTIGVPFEKHLVQKLRASFPKIDISDTQHGILLRHIEDHSHAEHEGHDCSADKETLDPHLWLDPIIVKTIAQNMSSGYKTGNDDTNDSYKTMLSEFLIKLDRLDAYISRTLAPFKGQKLYVFHPSFGYFCDRYHLLQVAIETGGKEPSARQLAELITQAKKEKIKTIIIQSQFSKKTAEAIASEIGAEVIALDPLAYDYINNMKYMADTIAKALSK
ncbi:MAG: zinc ABC transporter substrate-binding protein [candidate division Zixibacteria bacterium]|nr:zinc ABC transporter substrate-binding protein [candidate division Zixibacteria bacterium]